MSENFRKLVLVRHAESKANRDRTLTGRVDSDLTRRGVKQAKSAARYIGREVGEVNLVFSSPMRRTVRTARMITRRVGARLECDELLMETDFGSWEGLGRKELKGQPEWNRYVQDPFHFVFPGGESPQDVRGRVDRFIHKLFEREAWHCAVVVTHYTPLAFFVLHVLGNSGGSRAPFAVDNASVTVLHMNGSGGYIEQLNRVP
jgi:broad specificity phosphatase PhoE